MASNKQDKELLELLTKLYDIQETVGSKPKTSTADKRNRAENGGGNNTMGKGRKAKKPVRVSLNSNPPSSNDSAPSRNY